MNIHSHTIVSATDQVITKHDSDLVPRWYYGMSSGGIYIYIYMKFSKRFIKLELAVWSQINDDFQTWFEKGYSLSI